MSTPIAHVNVASTAIRAPELLIPGRHPTGPMTVDWSHPMAKGLILALFAGMDLVSGRKIPWELSHISKGGRYYGSLTSSAFTLPLPHSPEFTLIAGLQSHGWDASGYERFYLRDNANHSTVIITSSPTSAISINFTGASYTWNPPNSTSSTDELQLAASSNGAAFHSRHIETGVWMVNAAGGPYAVDKFVVDSATPEIFARHFFVWDHWKPRDVCEVLLRDPYQFLVPR